MNINFFDKKCQSQTHRHKFGICDPPSPSENPAYLDTENPSDWIAIVENSQEIEVTFTAIDKCIEIRKVDSSIANNGLFRTLSIFKLLSEQGFSDGLS
jgi:hypothetical protein